MPEIQDVTGTAFIVAEYRVRENAEQKPLYRDPIVPLFLSKQTHQAADRVAADFPPGVQGVILRTRYFDDRLDEQLSRGCRQVVIPGAGLDTRGERKQKPGVTYFEIDAAEILNFKKERLAKAGIEAQVVYIPGNYVTDGLLPLLAANGFNFDLPSYVIWEGNTMYLNRPEVLKVLTDLRNKVVKFAISFDYLTEAVINYVTDGLLPLLAANGFNFDLPSYVIWEGNTMYLNRPKVLKVLTDLRNEVVKFAISFDYLTEAVINYATGDERISVFTKHFAEMDAPWTFGIDDLDALAGDAGLVVDDNVKTAELFRTFWPNRQLDAKWYDNYALCTLAAP